MQFLKKNEPVIEALQMEMFFKYFQRHARSLANLFINKAKFKITCLPTEQLDYLLAWTRMQHFAHEIRRLVPSSSTKAFDG